MLRFAVVETRVDVAGRRFDLLHPRSADELISEDEFDVDERLPYWADIWPSARVLAERCAGLVPDGFFERTAEDRDREQGFTDERKVR